MNVSSWFSKMVGGELTLANLKNVLNLQLDDLHSAETQIIAALPKMIEVANSASLKTAFENHLEQSHEHLRRLEESFKRLKHAPTGETCEAMEGLITEAEEVIDLDGDSDVKDAALIAATQRIEHYEIAGYGCARTFARRLGHWEVANLLQKTLNEEKEADAALTFVAEAFINAEAART